MKMQQLKARRNDLVMLIGLVSLSVLTGWLTVVYPTLVPTVFSWLLGCVAFCTIVYLFHRFYVSHRFPLVALHLCILVLPASNLLLAMLYQRFSIPAGVIRLGLYWEETLVLITFVIVVGRVLVASSQRIRLRVHAADIIALVFATQVCGYLVAVPFTTPGLSPVELARAARDHLLFLLVYVIGRIVPLTDVQGWRVLRSLALVAIMTSVMGIIERFLIPIDFFVQLGLPTFFSDIVGYTFSGDSSGLPENFWGAVGQYRVRRATSVYTSSQPFAISFMLLLPTYIWLTTRSRTPSMSFLPSPSATIFWALVAFFALVLTITRANIALGSLQLLLAIFLLQSRSWHIHRRLAWILGALLLCSQLVLVVAHRPIFGLVWNTVTFQEGSSAFHKESWEADIQHVRHYPFGRGIGTAGLSAARVAQPMESSAGGEGQYSKLVRELGPMGVVLYIGIFIGVIIAAYRGTRVSRHSADSRDGISFLVLLAAVALLLNSLVTEWQGALSTSIVFWWLAGATIRRQLQKGINDTGSA